MINKWLCCLLVLIAFGLGALLVVIYHKKAYEKGVQDGKNLVLNEWVQYMTPEEVIDICHEFLEDDDHCPLLLIRPDKYDYIDGHGEDIQKIFQ